MTVGKLPTRRRARRAEQIAEAFEQHLEKHRDSLHVCDCGAKGGNVADHTAQCAYVASVEILWNDWNEEGRP